MIMVADSLPGLKGIVRSGNLSEARAAMAVRLIAAFILHPGRMSCLQAAATVRSENCHRAQVSRFLAKGAALVACVGDRLRDELMRFESSRGTYVFIVDATLCGQAGKRTENTYSTGNRIRRKRKEQRYSRNRHHRRSCHSFTVGLLITPSGLRIPVVKPYHTRDYCKTKKIDHCTTAEAAAAMVRDLKVPAEARVIVVGDTAYESRVVREACKARGFHWIFPSNHERVLEGPKGRRVRVRSLMDERSAWSWLTIRLVPSRGEFAAHRRLSRHRIGSKVKSKTYHVHEERRNVRSVGDVRIVFSTTSKDAKTASLDDTKILLTNAPDLSVREIVDIYSLRWQVELFFKELKSMLGFTQYRFRRFDAVEAWASLAITTFLYLEWYRAKQLHSSRLSAEKKKWWVLQRTHGLCQAIRLATEGREVDFIAKRLETRGGINRLKSLLKGGFAAEYRAAM